MFHWKSVPLIGKAIVYLMFFGGFTLINITWIRELEYSLSKIRVENYLMFHIDSLAILIAGVALTTQAILAFMLFNLHARGR